MLTQEQLDERRLGIGGSDAPVVLGLSPWGSQLDIWRAKVEGIDPPANNAMRVGNALEPFIRDAVSRLLGVEVETPERAFVRGVQRANLDGIVTVDGRQCNLQIKLTRSKKLWAAGVPVHVQAQVQHEMYAADLPASVVAMANLFDIMNDDWTPALYTIERDDAAINEIVARENEWWEKYVVARVAPE
jgi:putative phage-type endonuclease